MEPIELAMVALGMVFVIVLLSGIFRFAHNDDTRKAGIKLELEREKTHREIASHVASGSLSVDDAERLIRAMGQADEASINAANNMMSAGAGAASAV